MVITKTWEIQKAIGGAWQSLNVCKFVATTKDLVDKSHQFSRKLNYSRYRVVEQIRSFKNVNKRR